MTTEVDSFLMHYGVKGMKWGHRRNRDGSPRPTMSAKKKAAIAAGVGVTVAVGAAIAFSILDKKVNDGGGFAFGDLPVQTMTTSQTMMRGKANLIFNAAAMDRPVPPTPKKSVMDSAKERVYDTARKAAVKKIQNTSYDDFRAMRNPPPRSGFKAKAEGAIMDRANEVVIKKIRDVATAQADQIDLRKRRRRS